MHGREWKCVEEAPQAKKIRYFLRQNKKWCFKIAPQAKNFEYLALGIRFLLRKSSLDNVRFPKIFFPPTMGGEIPQNFLDFPPTVGGKCPRFPPHHPLKWGGNNPRFPPHYPPKWGGNIFKNPHFPPSGGEICTPG